MPDRVYAPHWHSADVRQLRLGRFDRRPRMRWSNEGIDLADLYTSTTGPRRDGSGFWHPSRSPACTTLGDARDELSSPRVAHAQPKPHRICREDRTRDRMCAGTRLARLESEHARVQHPVAPGRGAAHPPHRPGPTLVEVQPNADAPEDGHEGRPGRYVACTAGVRVACRARVGASPAVKERRIDQEGHASIRSSPLGRPFLMSPPSSPQASRVASAMIVNCGLTPSELGAAEP